MVRLFSGFLVLAVFVLAAGLTGCGSGTSSTNFAIPGAIIVIPTGSVSMDLGTNQAFTATIHDFHGNVIAGEPVTWQTSNASVASVANNGLVCAGKWDSLSNPQICTAGQVGVALVTATAQGDSSPPTTIYVHQHVDSIVVDNILPPDQRPPCVSKGLTQTFVANATSHGVDVTSTVGPFSFALANPDTFMELTNLSNASLPVSQVELTGNVPGATQITATAANTSSAPFPVTTCAVEAITLNVTNTPNTSFNVPSGQSVSVTATVIDSQNVTIDKVPLTWCASDQTSVSVGSSASGTAASNCTNTTASSSTNMLTLTTPAAGGGTVTASCTPPNCNSGFTPSLPIYATVPIHGIVNKTSSSTTPTGTVWVGSTGCGTSDNCNSTLFPITVPANTVGSQVVLPATPNSLVFNHSGIAYLSTDFSLLGTQGLMAVTATATPATVGVLRSVTGKLLAISPGGEKLILSDTNLTPNQVFIFDASTNTPTALQITGATAAAFSPDNLKAFIVAGSTLYIYSTVDALQTIPLNTAANDVAFLAGGIAGYMAGGDSSGVTFFPTCDSPLPGLMTVSLPSTPLKIRALPDGQTLLTLTPPNVQTITATVSAMPMVLNPPACPLTAPTPLATISNTVNPAINLGQGTFTPTQLLVSADGLRAYILAQNIGSIFVFDIGNQSTSSISLARNVTANAAALTTDGSRLYVAASDGQVHVLDTLTGGGDIQQVSFPKSLCLADDGTDIPCAPDLIAIQ